MIDLTSSSNYQVASKLEAVVLDWAGTAVDFGSRAPIVAILAAFEAAGVPVTEAEARKPMGRAKRDHLRDLLAQDSVAQRWRAKHGQNADETALDRIYEDFLLRQAECVAENSGLIEGCLTAIEACRQRGLRIGSSTGYTANLLAKVALRASKEGYEPDVMLSADDVSPGRPAPWLCIENARQLGVSSMAAVVKVDDTPAGVTAGRNAGCWSIGVVASGNEVGLSSEALAALAGPERQAKLDAASKRLAAAGAHLLIDSIAELPEAVDCINTKLKSGERP